MRTFTPTVPSDITAIVRGNLYWSVNKAALGQDMLEVSFPTGVLIAAGWTPEGSENGSYEVVVSIRLDVVSHFMTKSFSEAQSYIQEAVWRIGRNQRLPQMLASSSDVYREGSAILV